MAALLLSWEHLWRFSVFKVHRRAWVFKYIALLLTNIAKLRTGAHLFLDKLCLIAIISFYSMLCIHKFLSFMLVFLSESFIFDCRQVYKTLFTDVLIYRWNPKRSNTYTRCYFTRAIVRLQIQFLCLNKQRSTICFMQRKIWVWASFIQFSEGLSGFCVFIAIGYEQTAFCCSLKITPFLNLFEILFL